MFVPYEVLDHGFVRVMDYMGDDAAVAEMARNSYGEGTKRISSDRGLLRYLMRHWHTSPFEGCSIKLHMKMPIFVMRQLVRHRTAKLNEYSARYSVMRDEFYVPPVDRICEQSKANNQGSGQRLPLGQAEYFHEQFDRISQEAYALYESMLGADMARELARGVLPVTAYTELYWKIDLHNLMHFLRLRADKHAQEEIRVYANLICEIVKRWVPEVWGAFEEYRLHAVQFGRTAMAGLVELLDGIPEEVIERVLQEKGLGGRELAEVLQTIENVREAA